MLGVCIEVIMYLIVEFFFTLRWYICTGIRWGSLWTKKKKYYKMEKKSQYSNTIQTKLEKRVEKPHNKFLFFKLFCLFVLFALFFLHTLHINTQRESPGLIHINHTKRKIKTINITHSIICSFIYWFGERIYTIYVVYIDIRSNGAVHA